MISKLLSSSFLIASANLSDSVLPSCSYSSLSNGLVLSDKYSDGDVSSSVIGSKLTSDPAFSLSTGMPSRNISNCALFSVTMLYVYGLILSIHTVSSLADCTISSYPPER